MLSVFASIFHCSLHLYSEAEGRACFLKSYLSSWLCIKTSPVTQRKLTSVAALHFHRTRRERDRWQSNKAFQHKRRKRGRVGYLVSLFASSSLPSLISSVVPRQPPPLSLVFLPSHVIKGIPPMLISFLLFTLSSWCFVLYSIIFNDNRLPFHKLSWYYHLY